MMQNLAGSPHARMAPRSVLSPAMVGAPIEPVFSTSSLCLPAAATNRCEGRGKKSACACVGEQRATRKDV